MPTVVIGVMPGGFSFPQNEDLWLPLVPTPELDKRDARGLWFAFGRLADDATAESARAELETIGRRLAIAYPRTNDGWVPQPRTFAEFFVGRDAPLIYGAMWGAVGFLLLIACANLANLMLARTIGKARDVSVRVALGAGRWRIIRQSLVESFMLSAMGGAAGWWIATWGVHAYQLTANPPTVRGPTCVGHRSADDGGHVGGAGGVRCRRVLDSCAAGDARRSARRASAGVRAAEMEVAKSGYEPPANAHQSDS